MTLRRQGETTELDTLLTVDQAAERLGTSVRFVRRLIAERRIAYVKLGRHVRIAAEDLEAFIVAGRVEGAAARRAVS
jgi:excisionase family DNA binding protein